MENEILNYLEAFQICDSTFPIGTFNHSFGMENYLHDWRIKKAPEFNVWITNYYRSQFKYGEGLLTKICYEAIEHDDFEKIIEYDNSLTKATLALETREGTKMIAHQMIGLINRIYGNSINLLNRYEQAIDDGKAYGNPAIVFTIFAHYKGLKQSDLTQRCFDARAKCSEGNSSWSKGRTGHLERTDPSFGQNLRRNFGIG